MTWEDLFVSSNQHIDLGSEWLQSISRALTSATVVIALFSPDAMQRQWVHFEAGGAFFHHNKFLIPLCIGGMKPSDLGKPYANLQGADLHDWRTAQHLVSTLAKLLHPGMRPAGPRQYEQADEDVRRLIEKLDAWKETRVTQSVAS